MFLRKLFNPERKVFWVWVDLVVVIIGVYLAFVLQSSNETSRLNKEQDRILTALKYEVEAFRYKMYQTTLGAKSRVAEMKQTADQGKYSPFIGLRFIEPQHDYQTIQYAINHNNTEVIDFELFNVLQSFLVEVKKLEHTEELITNVSLQYRSLPNDLDASLPEHQIIKQTNYDNFRSLLVFTTDRLNISARIVESSKKTLNLLNERLGTAKVRKIEKDILLKNMHLVESEQQALQVVKKFFPNFSEAEVKALYQEAQANN